MRAILCVCKGGRMEKIRSGVIVAELFQDEKKIYKVWSADLFECRQCGIKVVSDFADRPMAQWPQTEEMKQILNIIAEAKRMGKYYEWPEHPERR